MEEHKKESIEFLLKEFDNTYAEWRRTNDLGNTKLQFQFTVVSALFGLLGLLMQSNNIPQQQLAYYFIVVFTILTLINWQTFDYMVSRLTTTDFNIRALSRIRRFFIENDPELVKYVSFQTDDSPSKFIKLKKKGILWTSRLVFCFSIAGFFASIVYLILHSMKYSNFTFILSLLASYFITNIYIKRRIDKYLSNTEKDVRFGRISAD